MILTEDEAKTKWCPFARVVDGVNEQSAVNRRQGLRDPHFPDPACIASACMAWRWFDEESDDHPGMTHARITGELTPRRGYCGLAGKP